VGRLRGSLYRCAFSFTFDKAKWDFVKYSNKFSKRPRPQSGHFASGIGSRTLHPTAQRFRSVLIDAPPKAEHDRLPAAARFATFGNPHLGRVTTAEDTPSNRNALSIP
jgi:hypothetical protein